MSEIKANDTADLVSVLSSFVGFNPRSCVIGMFFEPHVSGEGRERVQSIGWCHLPTRETGIVSAHDTADALTAAVKSGATTATLILYVEPEQGSPVDPAISLGLMTLAAEMVGIDVDDAIGVATMPDGSQTWLSLLRCEERCAREGGHPVIATEAAAEAALAGWGSNGTLKQMLKKELEEE